MRVIASAPTAPSRNPPRASYSSLGGRTVRLEAPDELTGRWDGPVYKTIGRDPVLRESASSPFFDDADGLKRPAWQATLTFLLPGQRRSDVDPALQEHFVRHTSKVYLCGQVLSYVRASTIVLVDDINLVLDPGCSYLCMPNYLT
ncbi:uncharacterized protein PITG_06523 [Phytophthora infestans T30-4]|uniref:Uncharacterized protein n=1 Tax=Phytophthora infestans (strain T30-4) TaxID=403677 RepID=D0N518_PHYIT|nr:uncharacterized protein PITG_06523 [Phytophthora infestans T30-4]EEY69976.1 conserved hypothetical protein [Phytophthora infestans T30-4]|eukprot:XP_002998623.1 conserved hypothetical protein [Phytophthora infestans T30-4]